MNFTIKQFGATLGMVVQTGKMVGEIEAVTSLYILMFHYLQGLTEETTCFHQQMG